MEQTKRSPWWYRQRGSLIGTIYGAGFFLAYLTITGVPPQPALVVWGTMLGSEGAPLLAWFGIALVFVAWLWRAAGTAYLRREVVFSDEALQDRLIVAGPFRYVRNPLYLGNIFLALGVGLYAPPLGFAIIVAGNIAIVIALAHEEALHMAARYGDAFAAYCRAVPAFVPRLTPARVAGSSTVTPSIGSALVGESGVALVAIALIPIALYGTAGMPAFLILGVAALASSFVINVWLLRRPGTNPRT